MNNSGLFTNTIFEIIETADLMEIDGIHSVRYFGLDTDINDKEDIALHVEVVDSEYQKYEFFFSVEELNEAEYHPKGQYWSVPSHKKEEMIKLKFMSLAPTKPYETIISEARNMYACDDIEVDDNADVRPSSHGMWVNGWLWVPNTEVDEEHG